MTPSASSLDGLADLIAQAQSGQQDAWPAIAERIYPSILRHALRVMPSGAEADDVAQDAMLKIHECLAQFTPRGAAPDREAMAWMLRITTTTALMALRHHQAVARRHERAGTDRYDAPVEEPSDRIMRRESERLVRKALAELPEDIRTAIEAKHYHGKSYAEIAELMQVQEGTAKMRVHRGLERLRDLLRRHDDTHASP